MDGEAGWTAEDASILSSLVASSARRRPALLVVNKADRAPAAVSALAADVGAAFESVISTSAARSEGIAELEAAVAHVLGMGGTAPEGAAWAANQRQVRTLAARNDAARDTRLIAPRCRMPGGGAGAGTRGAGALGGVGAPGPAGRLLDN